MNNQQIKNLQILMIFPIMGFALLGWFKGSFHWMPFITSCAFMFALTMMLDKQENREVKK